MKDDELGTLASVTVTVCVLVAGAVQVPLGKRLYVTVPPAPLPAIPVPGLAPVNSAESLTVLPSGTLHGEVGVVEQGVLVPPGGVTSIVVEMVGVKKMAEVAIWRSWLPVDW